MTTLSRRNLMKTMTAMPVLATTACCLPWVTQDLCSFQDDVTAAKSFIDQWGTWAAKQAFLTAYSSDITKAVSAFDDAAKAALAVDDAVQGKNTLQNVIIAINAVVDLAVSIAGAIDPSVGDVFTVLQQIIIWAEGAFGLSSPAPAPSAAVQPAKHAQARANATGVRFNHESAQLFLKGGTKALAGQ